MTGTLQVDATKYLKVVRDALRYRWLRSEGFRHINFEGLTCDTCDVGLDHAIDEEIAKLQPKGSIGRMPKREQDQ